MLLCKSQKKKLIDKMTKILTPTPKDEIECKEVHKGLLKPAVFNSNISASLRAWAFSLPTKFSASAGGRQFGLVRVKWMRDNSVLPSSACNQRKM